MDFVNRDCGPIPWHTNSTVNRLAYSFLIKFLSAAIWQGDEQYSTSLPLSKSSFMFLKDSPVSQSKYFDLKSGAISPSFSTRVVFRFNNSSKAAP